MKNKNKIGIAALIIVALIATLTAVAHLSCIYLGASCFQAQMAPTIVVQSAIDGTWLAPIGTIIVSLMFLLCAAYALSGAGILRRLPFLHLGIYTISILCVFRGLTVLPFLFLYPGRVSTSAIIASGVWFVSGLLFYFGYKFTTRKTT